MTLSRDAVRAIYDGFGARQDSQSWYEDAALAELTAHGRFDTAQAVLELGCGTGRYAAMLLDAHLPPHATYRGLDLSGTMIDLTAERLRRFGGRAAAVQADVTEPVAAPDGTAARPKAPDSRVTSTSTVGLPRLSRISRPVMSAMALISVPSCSLL